MDSPDCSCAAMAYSCNLPMDSPYCSCAGMAYSCSPYGDSLLQLCRHGLQLQSPYGQSLLQLCRHSLQLQPMWTVPAAAVPPWPTAAVPMEIPYCSCRLTLSGAAGEENAEIALIRLRIGLHQCNMYFKEKDW